MPKINGSNKEVLEILIKLFDYLNGSKTPESEYLEETDINNMKDRAKDIYSMSNKKIIYMIRRFVRDGFTSFWQ